MTENKKPLESEVDCDDEMVDCGETTVSKRSLNALDALNFFLADVAGGIGPYLAIYLLANQEWNAAKIGWAMSAAGITGVIAQTPAGALVDKIRRKRFLVSFAVALIAVSCVSMVFWTSMTGIVMAQIATGLSGAVIGPSVAAITLGLVGHKRMARQTGRVQAIGHVGNIFYAIAAGLLGYYLSNTYIFYLVAVISVFTIISILRIKADDIDYDLARGAAAEKSDKEDANVSGIWAVLRDKRILVFAAAVILFHFANAAMLPLVAQELAKNAGEATKDSAKDPAALYMSACIITSQLVSIPVSAYGGKFMNDWGRKPIFLIAFIALPIRGVMYILSDNPYYLVSVQILDGIAGGIFGLATLIMISDLTSGTGRFNLVQGTMGTATGIGASLSTVVAGYIVKSLGYDAGFIFLAAIAGAALIVFWMFVGETKDLKVDKKDHKNDKRPGIGGLQEAEVPA